MLSFPYSFACQIMTTEIRAHNEVLATLEALVDGKGVRYAIEALAEVASAKADHIRENWQDEPLAAKWDRKAAKLLRCAESLKRI